MRKDKDMGLRWRDSGGMGGGWCVCVGGGERSKARVGSGRKRERAAAKSSTLALGKHGGIVKSEVIFKTYRLKQIVSHFSTCSLDPASE